MVHVPEPTSETDDPDTVHTPALAGSTENATASPELAVAETMYGDPPAVAPTGGVDVKSIVCTLNDGVVTANDCCTSTAAWKVPSPGWSASTVHVPGPTSETAEPNTVHTPALLTSAENTTARPELDEADTA